MKKQTNRDKILNAGLHVLIRRGYCGASVRDIAEKAKVPLGSFTNHFASKEDFSLEVLDLYYGMVRESIAKTVRNDALPPLRRLRTWIDWQVEYLKESEMRSGCLIGNLGSEASDHSERIRHRLGEILEEINESVAYCLKAAVKAGELPKSTDCDNLASFIFAALHGAILQSKVDRSAEPLERCIKVLFSSVLR